MSAATTAFIVFEFASSAAAAVAASVRTPAETVASSGTAVTTPWPDRRHQVGLGGVAARGLGTRDADQGGGSEEHERRERKEPESSHALHTPPRGFLSHVRYQFVDCRWSLDDPGLGRRLYLEAHIPGAAFLDVEHDLSAPPGRGGRHPLPAAGQFAEAASAAPGSAPRFSRRLRHRSAAPSASGGCSAISATTPAR